MAIDTKAKRMSMLSFASPLAWQNLFEVDGAVDADDRAHLLHLYGGNALNNPSPPTTGYPQGLQWISRGFGPQRSQALDGDLQ